jgi:hypothetical protein
VRDACEPALEPAEILVVVEEIGQAYEDVVDDLAGGARREGVDGAVEPVAEAAAQLTDVCGLACTCAFEQLAQRQARDEQLVGSRVGAKVGNGRLRRCGRSAAVKGGTGPRRG